MPCPGGRLPSSSAWSQGLCANAGLFKKLVESRCHWLPGRSDGGDHLYSHCRIRLFGGITASGSSFITAYLLQTGQGVLQAVFSTSFWLNLWTRSQHARLCHHTGTLQALYCPLPAPRECGGRRQHGQTQLYIAVGVVVLLVLFAAFMLRNHSVDNCIASRKRPVSLSLVSFCSGILIPVTYL